MKYIQVIFYFMLCFATKLNAQDSNEHQPFNTSLFLSFGQLTEQNRTIISIGTSNNLFRLKSNNKINTGIGLPIFADFVISEIDTGLVAATSLGLDFYSYVKLKNSNFLNLSIAPLVSFVGLKDKNEFSYLSFLVTAKYPIFSTDKLSLLLGAHYKSQPIIYNSIHSKYSYLGIGFTCMF